MNIPRLPASNPADTSSVAVDDHPDAAVVATGQTDFKLPSTGSRRGVPRWAMLVAAVAVVGVIGANMLGGSAAVVEENEPIEEPAEDLRALFTEADGGPDTEADLGPETESDEGVDPDTVGEVDGPPATDPTQPETDSPPATDATQPEPEADSTPTTDPDVIPTTDPASSDQGTVDAPATTDA